MSAERNSEVYASARSTPQPSGSSFDEYWVIESPNRKNNGRDALQKSTPEFPPLIRAHLTVVSIVARAEPSLRVRAGTEKCDCEKQSAVTISHATEETVRAQCAVRRGGSLAEHQSSQGPMAGNSHTGITFYYRVTSTTIGFSDRRSDARNRNPTSSELRPPSMGRRGCVFRAAAAAACLALLYPAHSEALHAPSLPLAMPERDGAAGMRLRGGGPLDLFKRAPPPPPPAPVVRMAMPTGSVEILTVIAMAAITHFTRPSTLTSVGGLPTIAHVWYYGWVAALSTGLGALPLIFLGKVTDVWLGLSNAVAVRYPAHRIAGSGASTLPGPSALVSGFRCAQLNALLRCTCFTHAEWSSVHAFGGSNAAAKCERQRPGGALQAGMMLSASLHLIQEGLDLDADGD
jgi:hypothetical protein